MNEEDRMSIAKAFNTDPNIKIVLTDAGFWLRGENKALIFYKKNDPRGFTEIEKLWRGY